MSWGYSYPEVKVSVFRGETWSAFRPGEDKAFRKNWVTRRKHGDLCAVVNTKKQLTDNAKLCQVKLRWKRKSK